MKVLHLHAGTLYGGVETFLLTLVRQRALCPEMEHHFALCFDTVFTRQLRDADTDVTLIGEVRFRNPLSIMQTRTAFRKLAAEVKPNVAIGHMPKPFWLYSENAHKMGIPIAFYMH